MVPMLVKAKADVNSAAQRGVTPLMMACQTGHPPTAAALLKHGAQVDTTTIDGHTALMNAAKAPLGGPALSALLRLLVDAKADIEKEDGAGRSALTAAAMLGRWFVCKALLAAGAKCCAFPPRETRPEDACVCQHLQG